MPNITGMKHMRSIFLALYLLPLASIVLGQAGTLDPSFDGDGIVTTRIDNMESIGLCVAVQADGKILFGGLARNEMGIYDMAVVRYLPDGTLDAGFSGDGLTTISFGPADGSRCKMIAVLPDGGILLGGVAYGASGEFALAKLTADGELDNGFGTGGLVRTDMSPSEDDARALVVQEDGKIVVVGTSGVVNLAIARYTSSGELDTGFSDDGFDIPGIPQTHGNGVAMQPDGMIVLCGQVIDTAGYHFLLARYTTDGSLDLSLGQDGHVLGNLYSTAFAIAVQPDGKIVLGGSEFNGMDDDFALARYNPDGSPDVDFGNGGTALFPFSSAQVGYAMQRQPDGRILIGGPFQNEIDGTYDLGVVRFNSDGSVDAGFGTDGLASTSIGPGDDQAFSLALQPEGRILLAGTSYIDLPEAEFAMVRYTNDLNVGVEELNAVHSPFVIYPDPVVDRAVIEFELCAMHSLTCELMDDQGRTVRTFHRAPRPAGRYRENIDLAGLAAGYYVVRMRTGSSAMSRHIVKQ